MLPIARYCAARRGIGQVDLSAARACCLILALLVGSAAAWADDPKGEGPTIRQGRELFVKQWQEHDRQSPSGDGLGPMYNARSCAECHSQGGVGGGGKAEHNVELLNLIAPERKEGVSRQTFIEAVAKIHPTLVPNPFTVRPSITLHRFGLNPAYEKWRVALVLLAAYLPAGQVPDRIGLEIARRNTPALFGAGVIDAIPDGVLEDVARRQQAQRGDVKGRVAVAGGGKPGKFGWRGQTASLEQFVMGACANELGLQVPENNQPQDPLDPSGKAPGLDLKQEQCNALVAFVASLPPPAERLPLSYRQKQQWAAGSQLFRRVGCADCHLPKLGEVAGIYSDLLLHDMGPDLADQAGANPPSGPTPLVAGFVAYYGGPQSIFVEVPPVTKRQWRTPPLWGVAESRPYLHDGRAATLEEAILLHGGEAATSKKKFAELKGDNRANLLAYLQSLGQPAQ